MIMCKKTFILNLCVAFATVVCGQKRELHILAINDAHANIEAMPQLTAIADSLRALYPSLLVFSAGDNRTGDPLNDMYDIPAYPMVALMNLAGFNGSAVGNHEFDGHSLPRLCAMSAFRYICANMTADDSTGIHVVPYQLFDADGLKVGVVGAIQLNQRGIPNAHPDLLKGLHFTSPFEAVNRHQWLRSQCDVTILLSHVGYQEDLQIAQDNPWIDVIIGGHSHKQLSEEEPLHNGVLVTQNRNMLGQAAHVTLTVDSGRVVGKQVEYIVIRSFHRANPVAADMVRNFTENPSFKRVLTHAETPFRTRNEIGTMMCDAMMDATGADVAILNYRGIRISKLHSGDITVYDALAIDPYGSNAAVLTMTGAELEKFITTYGMMNTYKFPHLGGLTADLTLVDPADNDIKEVMIMTADGSKLKRKKKYSVVTNTYVMATNKMPLTSEPTVLNTTTSEIIISYLERQQSVSYRGKGRLHYKTDDGREILK